MPAGNTNRSHQHRLATTQTQEGKKPSLPPKPDDFSALIPRAQAATTRAGARQGRPRAVPSRSCRAFLCPAVRHRCSPPLMRNPKLTRGHCWDRSIICSLPGASLPAWTTGIFICGWPASGEGHGLGRDEQDPGKVSWIFASFQGYQGKVLQRGNPERGSSKMCPSILETWSSPSLKGLERVGSPFHIFLLQKERNCWIAPCACGGCPWTRHLQHWVVFRVGTSFFGVVQAQLAPRRPVPLSERGSVPRAWPCRAVSAHGHLGWVAVARFQCSPLGRVLSRPRLSAPAIPSSLARTFPPGLSGAHPAPCSPFTVLSPSLQPWRKGERTSALISPFHPLSAHL